MRSSASSCGARTGSVIPLLLVIMPRRPRPTICAGSQIIAGTTHLCNWPIFPADFGFRRSFRLRRGGSSAGKRGAAAHTRPERPVTESPLVARRLPRAGRSRPVASRRIGPRLHTRGAAGRPCAAAARRDHEGGVSPITSGAAGSVASAAALYVPAVSSASIARPSVVVPSCSYSAKTTNTSGTRRSR